MSDTAITDGSDIAPEDTSHPNRISLDITQNATTPPPPTTTSPRSPSIPRLTLSPPLLGTSKPEDETTSSHRPSDASQRSQRMTLRLWSPRAFKAWKSPLSMTVFFLVGLGLSLAHCTFYARLDGVIVGASYQQEEKLRVGTALSFLAQLALTASVWKSYTQWLWRAAYGKPWTAKGLNKAFSVDLAPSSILSREFIKTFKLGAVMAFFGWCLILPAFFTPAALSVHQSTNETTTPTNVPYLSIANSSAGHEFAYSPPWNSPDTDDEALDTTRIFTGPRTVVMLLATATASNGEILRIDSPSNHSSYTIDFFGPIVRCEDANETTASLIDGFLEDHMSLRKGSAEQVDSAYYSFVPAFNATGDIVAYDEPRYQEPSNATNELWMTFQRWTNQNDQRVRQRVWQVCRLHNATYNVNLSWVNNIQNVTGTYQSNAPVPFPSDRPGRVSEMSRHAYAGFFWALTDQLVGSLGWFRETNTSANVPQFGAMESPIRHTSVLGSSDLDVFFDYKLIYDLYAFENEDKIQGQRRLDKILARNRTLDVLIEELSFNMTIGMLHNHLLTHNTTREVTYISNVNKYAYQPTSLFIPYALANVVALAAVILGFVSYWRDGTYPDKKFQDIAHAAEDPHIIKIIEQSRDEGGQPVDSVLVSSNGTRYWLRRLSRSASVTGEPAASEAPA